MILASCRSPISSFSVLPLILVKLFYYVALNPRGFHTFPQCLYLSITNSKSSFFAHCCRSHCCSSPWGLRGVLLWGSFFCPDWELHTLGKRFILRSWCECRGCKSGDECREQSSSSSGAGSCCLSWIRAFRGQSWQLPQELCAFPVWTLLILLGIPGRAELLISDERAACSLQQSTLETFRRGKIYFYMFYSRWKICVMIFLPVTLAQ